METLELKKGLYWVGVQDPGLEIFDIIIPTEDGTTYNSYILKGSEKTALFETSKAQFADEYLKKIEELGGIEQVDYIIVSHTEPDHAGTAEKLLKLNPSIKLVGSGTAISFMKEIINDEFNSIIVKGGDTLSLGDKTLHFITATNLHWPDTIMTYIEEDKTLVSCDIFGAHYAYEPVLLSKMSEEEEKAYVDAQKYYYDNIMAPFKPHMLKAIEAIKDLDIDMICTGHGPVIDKDPWKYVEQNKEWSTEVNPNEKKTVVMPYVSAYGYTGMLAEKIAEGIKDAADIDVKAYDMIDSDFDTVMNDIYWAEGLMLGTPTIMGDALNPILDITTAMYPVIHGGKIASAFGSYGWSGEGVPNIMARLKQLRMKIYGDGLRIRFKPSKAQLEEAYQYGYEFGLCVNEGKILSKKDLQAPPSVNAWRCIVCGYIEYAPQPPDVCPVCGVGPDKFVPVEEEKPEETAETEEHVIVLGGGIAALTAAEEVRKRNKKCAIEMISNEAVPVYHRPMLTKGILSEFEEINFYQKPKDWYSENNIELTLDAEVVEIDLEAKKLKLKDGTTKKYDKLVYATGAEGNIPPIKGREKENVLSIRHLADAEVVREKLSDIENIVVIGGGVLGLEAVNEFAKIHKNVTVIDMADHIMGRQLDTVAAGILTAAAEEAGVNVVTGVGTDEILGDDKVTGVRTSDGKEYPADLVVISAGIRPNSKLGIDAGLKGDRWIDVDKHMQTSDSSVWACGDVAAMDGVSIGIIDQATEMGKVAAANLTGNELEYKHVTPSNSFRGFGVSIFSIGDVGTDPKEKYEVMVIRDDSKETFKKLFFKKGRFCGGILMGNVDKSSQMTHAYELALGSSDPDVLSLLAD